jgi:hypothetical protein
VGFSVLGKGEVGVDELIAGALAVRARIVQSSALKLSEAARFATGEKRDPGIVRPVPNLIRSVDIQVNERVLLRPLIAALACR